MSKKHIPKDLNDCFIELSKILELKDLKELKNGTEEEMAGQHHFLGRYLRNTWELWGESCLSKWFNDQGIKHADDMSGIILDSFWRYLNSKPIKIDEQVKFYQDYWEKMKNEQN